jgi:hypothetical protein
MCGNDNRRVPRRLAVLGFVVAVAAAAPAAAQQDPGPPRLALPPVGVSQVPTHGFDPLTLDSVAEVPAAAGGARGRTLKMGVPVTADLVRRAEPEQWCGTPLAFDDDVNTLDNGDVRFHAIYAIPADADDRFSALASTLQADAFQASALLERLYGRALRFDMGTSCGPQYLDISVVRLHRNSAAYTTAAGQPNATFDTLVRDLAEAGFTTSAYGEPPDELRSVTNYLVWLDGPAPAGCGQAAFYPDAARVPSNLNNFGGKVAAVFRRGAGFCNSNAARHEIAHTLGALQEGAPHYAATHCSETPEDTMCPGAPAPAKGPAVARFFDVGNDDYWDPTGGALGWWTVDLSRFLCSIACNVPGGIAAVQDPGAGIPAAVVTHKHGGVWSYDVRVTAPGRGRIAVTCPRRGRTLKVSQTDVALPVRVRRKAPRCTGRPQVAVTRLDDLPAP